MSVSPALSSRTHCTPASDQRGPQGAEAKREGQPDTFGYQDQPDQTEQQQDHQPHLLGALAPSTDCEE